ncbi:MAG: hypothetical protein QNJ19_15515 [Woeseiaceae bacterium]|nr:hypothetical protein [Woeseiaceae bacterium]
MELETSTGEYKNYKWLASRKDISPLASLVSRSHVGSSLYITAYDSGTLAPLDGEYGVGWRYEGSVAISPPLSESVYVPEDEFEEWYLYESPNQSLAQIEVFVNYGGFTVESPDSLLQDRDPTWDRRAFEFLEPIQDRFWAQVDKLAPDSYIATGDVFVIVTKNRAFWRSLQQHVASRL